MPEPFDMAAPACPGTLQSPAPVPSAALAAPAPSKARTRPPRYNFRGAWLTSVLVHVGLVGLLAAFMPVVNPSGSLPPDAPVSVALLLEENEALPPLTVLPPELQPAAESVLKMPEPEPEAVSQETPALEDVAAVAAATPAAMPLDATHGVVTATWQQAPVRKQPPAPAQAAPETPHAALKPPPTVATTASGGGGGGGNGTGALGVGGGAGSGSGHGTRNGSGTGSGSGSGYGSGTGSGYGSGTGPGYGAGTGGTPAKAAAPQGKTCSARPKAQIAPRYPDDERRAGHTASVVLEVLIDEKGKLKDIRVLDDGGSNAFADSAVAAAKSARFEPALEDGVPVASYVKLRIEYRLR
ncbi:MAG: TonB family protein [Planctomycetes bacterium]|nr:TonB family protein [Planctomycetota bacterium]